MPHTHGIDLRLGSARWSLWGDGVLLAGMPGQHDAEGALDWAAHILKTTHGVTVDHWTSASGEPAGHSATVVDDVDECELFRFKPGRSPLPAVPWPGRNRGGLDAPDA
jgi:hypothetical protein